MANPFVHIELATTDLAAAKKFYGELFGWSFNDIPMDGGAVYSMFKPDSGPAGGMMAMPDMPPMWTTYVGVDNIHAATEKAKSLGAHVIHGPHEVPGFGAFTLFKDPGGAMIAMWQGMGA